MPFVAPLSPVEHGKAGNVKQRRPCVRTVNMNVRTVTATRGVVPEANNAAVQSTPVAAMWVSIRVTPWMKAVVFVRKSVMNG